MQLVVASQIGDRRHQMISVVPELPEATIAVEAEHTANFAGVVIMIDMIRLVATANRTLPALGTNDLIDLGRTNPVAPLQVVVARATVQSILRLTASCVVTRLAVRVPPVA
jgi:hypothetical protein